MPETEVPAAVRGLVFGDQYQKRIARSGETGVECCVCGRKARRSGGALGAGLAVRMDGGLGWPIPWGDPHEDGGYFPVGPECAKRFPAGYVHEVPAWGES